ncbi:hypothetical protein GGR50DRAFT_83564 [Xylaria sp. CBS 124048]|nr:hypothetical protein GGR50DRAFT_83564 [Xylaria sp. CBS 124048]
MLSWRRVIEKLVSTSFEYCTAGGIVLVFLVFLLVFLSVFLSVFLYLPSWRCLGEIVLARSLLSFGKRRFLHASLCSPMQPSSIFQNATRRGNGGGSQKRSHPIVGDCIVVSFIQTGFIQRFAKTNLAISRKPGTTQFHLGFQTSCFSSLSLSLSCHSCWNWISSIPRSQPWRHRACHS